MYPEPSTAQKILKEATAGADKALKAARKSQRNLGVNTPGLMDVFLYGGGGTSSGARVSEESSLRIIAVYACVSYIADYVASLPKITYERLARGKRRAVDHYLYNILHDRPNEFQNDYEFVETLTGHVLLWGNAYAEVERDRSGRVTNLWPLRPDSVRIIREGFKLFYFYRTNNGDELPLREVIHIRGLASDGVLGYSQIQLAREGIGLAFAEEEYRARFFSNNANPGGILEHPHQISTAGAERLKKQWNEAHAGLSNAHRVAVLEEGMKWVQMGIPAKDLEFIEGRKFQKSEIASLYRVKPYKIGIMEPGTVSYASIEQQAIDTHIDTMRPWVIKWEKKYSNLLAGPERQQFFVEFLLDAVLRGDTKSRYEAYQLARQNGWLNANEIRELENMNPIPGPEGDEYWRPSNMGMADEPVQGELPLQPKPLNGAAH